MNVTLNTNTFNTNNQAYKKYQQNSKPSFKGKTPAAEIAEFMSAIPEKSKLLKGLDDKYEKGAEVIGRKFTRRLVDNKVTAWCVDKVKNSKYLFNHMMAVGSAITSGMYMFKTLNNDQMDKDRKNTLAINQLLTFVISTAGAYAIDSKLGNWWEKKTADYASHQLSDDTLTKAFLKKNEEIAAKNAEIIKANKAKVSKKDLKFMLEDSITVKDFIKGRSSYLAEVAGSQKRLLERIDGMGILKSMIIFGAVYRFLVPVLVVPVANRLGDKMIEKRKAKEAEAAKLAGAQQPNKDVKQPQTDKKV